MTANSSSRLLPTTLQEKQNKIKQKSTFLMELLLGPVRHTLGHQNTKIFPPWSAALAAQSTISFLFFFFWTTPIKSNKTGKEKNSGDIRQKMAQLPQVHILPKDLKWIPPRLVNQSLVRGWLSCTQGNVMSSTISH